MWQKCWGCIFTVKVSQTVLTTVWSHWLVLAWSQRQFSIFIFWNTYRGFFFVRFSLFLMTALHLFCRVLLRRHCAKFNVGRKLTQFTKLVVFDGCFTELQNNWKSNRVVNAQTNYKTPAPYLVTKKVRVDYILLILTQLRKWWQSDFSKVLK